MDPIVLDEKQGRFGFLGPVFFLFSDDDTRSAAFDRTATEPGSVVRLASAGWRASAAG